MSQKSCGTWGGDWLVSLDGEGLGGNGPWPWSVEPLWGSPPAVFTRVGRCCLLGTSEASGQSEKRVGMGHGASPLPCLLGAGLSAEAVHTPSWPILQMTKQTQTWLLRCPRAHVNPGSSPVPKPSWLNPPASQLLPGPLCPPL